MQLIGKNKPLCEQERVLKEVLVQNKTLKKILEVLAESNLENYYIAAGCINQTVFNYYHGYDLEYGIKDYDIVYFDSDTSYEKEDQIIKYVRNLLGDIRIELDIKNEARVHMWYQDKFGNKIKPYTSVEDAISCWGTTITCIGVRIKDEELITYAPYGLNDLFNLVIRPNKIQFTQEQYKLKTDGWKKKWPLLNIVSWNDTRGDNNK